MVKTNSSRSEIGLNMSYTLNWHIEKRVIYLKLFDAVSVEELIQSNGETIQFIAAGTQPIHVIIDTLDVKSFPTNLRWIIHMIQSNEVRADGWRIMIVNDSTIHVLLKTILSVLHKPIHSCSSIQEAHDFIQELDTPAYASVH